MAVTRRTRIVLWVGLALVLGAVAFMAVVGIIIYRTIETTPSTAEQADSAMASVRRRYGGQQPLLEIVDLRTKNVRVHRIRGRERRGVQALHFMIWEPSEQTLTQGQAPGWTLRLKLSLFGSGGWSLDEFGVTPEDVERHAPGVLIDQRMPSGEHVLVWVE